MATKRHNCKGCGNYLNVPPEQPCPICQRVNKPKKKMDPHFLPQMIHNYYDGRYGRDNGGYNNLRPQPPPPPAAYGGGGYYNLWPQPPPPPAGYGGGGYSNPQPQASPPPAAYSDGYNNPRPQAPPPLAAYGGGGYNNPRPQESPPPAAYGGGYNNPRPQAPPPLAAYGGGYNKPQPQVTPRPAVQNDGYNNPRPQASPQQAAQVHEKKKAVLCGVTYIGHPKTLEASVNNVRSIHKLLVDRLGFPNASIRILTEEESNPDRTPTKRNMLLAMRWLTEGCQSGDSLVFYYAGHGSRVPDDNGDEKDGYDEALCPVDYSTAGMILDDEINATLVAPLPHGATLHCIIDTCFSGTLLDLPFLCRINQDGFYMWEDHHLSHASTYKGTKGGKAICISACDDHQNSADTSIFTGTAIGALTYSFIQAVQSEKKLTYGGLLGAMRKKIREAQQLQGLNAQFASSTSQEPQLSCSTRFEIYSKSFKL